MAVPDVDVDYDLADLLLVFDELASWTEEDRGIYALRHRRDDGVSVLLDFSVHEGKVGIVVARGEVGYAQVEFQRCRRIQALDVRRKVVEVRADHLRCLLALQGTNVLTVTQASPEP